MSAPLPPGWTRARSAGCTCDAAPDPHFHHQHVGTYRAAAAADRPGAGGEADERPIATWDHRPLGGGICVCGQPVHTRPASSAGQDTGRHLPHVIPTEDDAAGQDGEQLRDALRIHHPIMRSETGPFSGCRCGQVRLGEDVIAHVVGELRRALDPQ